MTSSYILLTRVDGEERDPALALREKERAVKEKIEECCPGVAWAASYATLGPWSYIDIFEAPDTETAMKVAALVRHIGGAQAEVWPAVSWEGYKNLLGELSEVSAPIQ
jgi:uncharacterized protein with GYD domain